MNTISGNIMAQKEDILQVAINFIRATRKPGKFEFRLLGLNRKTINAVEHCDDAKLQQIHAECEAGMKSATVSTSS